MLFTVPLSGSTIAAVTTCLSSADCSDSAAPMCSVNVCVNVLWWWKFLSPDGAYDSLAVMEYVDGVPMIGIPDHQHISAVRERTLWVQLGRLMAFDMLINNFDKLPLAWSNDGNLGT